MVKTKLTLLSVDCPYKGCYGTRNYKCTTTTGATLKQAHPVRVEQTMREPQHGNQKFPVGAKRPHHVPDKPKHWKLKHKN